MKRLKNIPRSKHNGDDKGGENTVDDNARDKY